MRYLDRFLTIDLALDVLYKYYYEILLNVFIFVALKVLEDSKLDGMLVYW